MSFVIVFVEPPLLFCEQQPSECLSRTLSFFKSTLPYICAVNIPLTQLRTIIRKLRVQSPTQHSVFMLECKLYHFHECFNVKGWMFITLCPALNSLINACNVPAFIALNIK